jgi:hypothetical protein
VSYDYGDLLLSFELQSFSQSRSTEGAWAGTAFYGSEGTLVAVGDGFTVFGPDGSVTLKVKESGGSHEGNFLDCVKSRKLPNADVEIGRRSTMMSHLGNISYKLGRDVKFDPATETFPHDPEASRLLSKSYSQAWPLPRV